LVYCKYKEKSCNPGSNRRSFVTFSTIQKMCDIQKNFLNQGCQMVCFQTKNPNLGKFCRVLLWKILVYFMTIWSNLRPLQIFFGHLVYFVVIWYIFIRFGILDQEKSGNPVLNAARLTLCRVRGVFLYPKCFT
jgi:hypothetical protein